MPLYTLKDFEKFIKINEKSIKLNSEKTFFLGFENFTFTKVALVCVWPNNCQSEND